MMVDFRISEQNGLLFLVFVCFGFFVVSILCLLVCSCVCLSVFRSTDECFCHLAHLLQCSAVLFQTVDFDSEGEH